jgi:hypothetical protein
MITITKRVRSAVAVLAASGAALATGPIVSAAHAQPNPGGSGKSSDKCDLKYAQNAGCDLARVLLRHRHTAPIAVSRGRMQLRGP